MTTSPEFIKMQFRTIPNSKILPVTTVMWGHLGSSWVILRGSWDRNQTYHFAEIVIQGL